MSIFSTSSFYRLCSAQNVQPFDQAVSYNIYRAYMSVWVLWFKWNAFHFMSFLYSKYFSAFTAAAMIFPHFSLFLAIDFLRLFHLYWLRLFSRISDSACCLISFLFICNSIEVLHVCRLYSVHYGLVSCRFSIYLLVRMKWEKKKRIESTPLHCITIELYKNACMTHCFGNHTKLTCNPVDQIDPDAPKSCHTTSAGYAFTHCARIVSSADDNPSCSEKSCCPLLVSIVCHDGLSARLEWNYSG